MANTTIDNWRPLISGNTNQDLRSLRQVITEISSLEYRLFTLRRSRLLLEAALAPYFSSIVPINRCPSEILVKIFGNATSDNISRLVDILLVCRSWHRIAMQTPSLWARITFKLPQGKQVDMRNTMNRVKTCISRSQQALLELDLDFSCLQKDWHNVASHTRDVHLLWSELNGRGGMFVERWKRLRLVLPELTGDTDVAEMMWKSLHTPAPEMVDLSVCNTDSALWPLRDPANGFSLREKPSTPFTDVRNLMSLTLDTPETFIAFFKTHSLVDIQYLDVPTWSVGAIASLLSQLRELQTLTLRRVSVLSSKKTPNLGPFVLDLPKLRTASFLSGFSRLHRVTFHLPVLETLEIGTPKFSIDLPNVDPLALSWTYEGDNEHDDPTELLQALIRTYKLVERIEIPYKFGQQMIELIKRRRVDGDLSPSLKSIGLKTSVGDVEMIAVH